MKLKELFRLTGLPVIFASLCCLSPIVIVLLGLGSLSFAGSLADNLYYNYRWLFRVIGVLLLVASLVYYFRQKGICTLDQAKKQRNKIINTVLITFGVSIFAYIIWLYVILHYVGLWLKIWE